MVEEILIEVEPKGVGEPPMDGADAHVLLIAREALQEHLVAVFVGLLARRYVVEEDGSECRNYGHWRILHYAKHHDCRRLSNVYVASWIYDCANCSNE